MDMAGFALTLIGTLAGIAGAYFGWVPVRRQLSRRRTLRVANSTTGAYRLPVGQGTDVITYDVFVSYSHADAALIKNLVARLQRRGIRVALDEVVLQPGTPLIHGVEQAIRNSTHGLLVFSKASTASGWVTNEYYVLMQRSIESGQLFIPVLLEDVPLPEFALTRFYSDLRDVTEEVFDQRLDQLVEALRAAS